MRSNLRVRVIVPLAVLGLLGAGFSAFALGKPPDVSVAPLPTPVQTTTKKAGQGVHTQPKKAARQIPVEKPTALERALRQHRVVVVLLYSPDAPYDTIQTREARAGALAAGAGFIAVNASNEKQVASFATEYEARDAPGMLFFRRGPRLVNRIDRYADRATVAQAVDDARA